MKANAPEKIYLHPDLDSIFGMTERSCESEIEYTRTDAFIEKVENFIYSALNDGIMGTANIEDFMRLFRNYMEGE